ncbi:oligosaccharide flippase family protein [Sphingobacterium sp. SG20118]|uniref:oligosaccharide flippase family protein n=1 Tax=Sphingobacterium sp. SG20118 TaxID=3367156 RepID=UPI0037DFC547
MFSEIQNDDEKIRKTYKLILLQVIYFICPFLIITSIVAIPLFRLVLTEKWLPIVPYFQALLIAGIFNPLQRFNLNILRIKNMPGAILWLNLARRVLFVVAIFIAINSDLLYMVYLQSFVMFLSFIMISYFVGKTISYTLLQLFKDVMPIFTFIVVWSITSYILFHFISKINNDILVVGVSYLLSISIYVVISKIINIQQLKDIQIIANKYLKK